jgi:hypothetical protein
LGNRNEDKYLIENPAVETKGEFARCKVPGDRDRMGKNVEIVGNL